MIIDEDKKDKNSFIVRRFQPAYETVEFTFRYSNEYKFRFWLGMKLIKLGCIVLNVGFNPDIQKIEHEGKP